MPSRYEGEAACVIVLSSRDCDDCGVECWGLVYDFIEKTPHPDKLVGKVDELMDIIANEEA